VSGREKVRRGLLAAGALLSLVLAVVLVFVAIDVARWNDAIRVDDVRYRQNPNDPTLWRIHALAPFGLAGRILSVDDDVQFRLALRALRGAHLDDPTAYISDPRIALRRNEAQARLEAVVARDPLRSRRSRAAGLLGVLGLARFVTETQDREALLSSTVLNFRRAIDLDPSNDEAKVNLELAYQRGRGVQINENASGQNPSPGGSGSRGAGAGQAGSGY
jgi:hypothetical protein